MSGPPATNYILIDDFAIDCSLRENHSFESDVTDYPTESGAHISDNIRPRPIEVEINGLVSNTPIGLMVNERENDHYRPTETAYLLLQSIRDLRKPVTITTSLRTFDNMAMKSLSIPRESPEDALRFTATFQQIQTVENVRTTRVSIPIASNDKGKGKGGGKTISKPGDEFSGRMIMIAKLSPTFAVWFDPDLPGWRRSAKWMNGDTREETDTGTIFRKGVGAWVLTRGEPALDVINIHTNGRLVSLTPASNQEDYEAHARSVWKETITVYLNACVYSFVIQTPTNAVRGPNYPSLTTPPPGVRPR